ncbi:MAG TPA: enoyl-CoA hydratase-related protein, partial [Steroidobacteraceae bacterium]|nr:enoyl-CoA hydratase-related protein [Steroidobacteraceae bacterium]
MSDPSPVLREKRGGALWITINRADRRNAINADVLAGIAQGYREAQMDAAIRVIVLTGAGDKAFCAGADLNPGQSLTFDYSQPTTAYADLLRLARACPIPTVARVNGACVAGGMGLLCMADIAIASDRATFSLPEVRIGLFPAQVVALLKELIPSRVLHEWC